MNKLLLVLSVFITTYVGAEVEMTRVDPRLFIFQPKTNFDSITLSNEALKSKMIEYLFVNDLIDHQGTKAYNPGAQFVSYYKQYKDLYKLMDLNRDGIPELLFNGYVSETDDREHVEIWGSKNGAVYRIYRDIGHLLAYKIHPNTHEILLYHHQYPCCVNASHNLNRLRLIGEKMQLVKRYFLGRDKDMVGPFFPKKSLFTGKFRALKKKTPVYWSPAIVEKHAWKQRSASNRIAHYDSLTVYTILASEKKWQFVLMKGAPTEEKNLVINPKNFKDTWIYCWIREE